MIQNTFIVVAIFTLTLMGCEDRAPCDPHSDANAEVEEGDVPRSFTEALDALDLMASEEDRKAYRNDEVDMGLVHRQVGMRLRNDWGLWRGSRLKDYFAERGIAHPDWISSAIFEGWIERLKTGTFDEGAIIAKYAKIEKDWRAWSENPDPYVVSEDNPFAEKPAEQGGADQPATAPESKSEGDEKSKLESKGRSQ